MKGIEDYPSATPPSVVVTCPRFSTNQTRGFSLNGSIRVSAFIGDTANES